MIIAGKLTWINEMLFSTGERIWIGFHLSFMDNSRRARAANKKATDVTGANEPK